MPRDSHPEVTHCAMARSDAMEMRALAVYLNLVFASRLMDVTLLTRARE